ncbi:MAG: YdcF family protein [Gammaproteobacteria bacterium]
MELILSHAAGDLLRPPGIVLLVLVLGLLLGRRWPRTALGLVVGAVVLLYVLSLPLVGASLMHLAESRYPPLSPKDIRADAAGAIVVLGAGRYADAPEYGGDTPSRHTLERLRYAARLHQLTGLPVLVSGGRPFGSARSEASLMRDSLQDDFHVPVRWIEGQSDTTWQNARNSAALLESSGVRRIYLVTHAAHMARAVAAFEQNGLQVIPAPTGFTTVQDNYPLLLQLMPQANALRDSSTAVREALGRVWYGLRR